MSTSTQSPLSASDDWAMSKLVKRGADGRARALLFCNHWPGRLEHDGRLAAAAAAMYGLETVVLTHGAGAVARALRAGFDHAADIGLSIDGAVATPEDLDQLSRVERTAPGRSFREDIEQDRWLHGRFPLEWSLGYLANVHRTMGRLQERFDIVAAIGEVNYAGFRLGRRILEGRGIPYLMFSFARIYPRFSLEPTFFSENPQTVATYRQFRRQGVPPEFCSVAQEAIDRIVVHRKPPNYTEAALRRRQGDRVPRQWIRKFLVLSSSERDHGNRFPAGPLPAETRTYARLRRLVAARRSGFSYRRAVKRSYAGSGAFGVYLLHDSPEYTVDTLGWPYRDQLWLVRRIAESLPMGMHLKVKEHVTMVGRRPARDYRNLARIPNVAVVPETENSRDLISSADLVFTISGTAALEALAFGVPAIAFSPVFFTHFDGIERCVDPLDLPLLIRNALERPRDGAAEEARAAFAAIYSSSHPGTPFLATKDWRDSENLDLVVRGFLSELATHVPGLTESAGVK